MPDPGLRAALEADGHRLPADFYDVPVPVPSEWPEDGARYVQLSAAYDGAAAEARFGVDRHAIAGVWGVESNFGKDIGGRPLVAVAGAHGKTTSTGMIVTALQARGVRPSFVNGGVIAQLEARYRQDTGINSLRIKHNAVLGYFIEVTAANADKLRSKLARFVDAATPVKGRSAPAAKRAVKAKAAAPAPANRDQVQAIREWAKSAGFEVSSRGRISKA